MAVLTDPVREEVWAQAMRDASLTRLGLNIKKADLRAAVNGIDDWVESNQATFNQSIPQPARTALTARQKLDLLYLIVRRRLEVA